MTWSALRASTPQSFGVGCLVQTVFLVALYATDGYDTARSGEVFRLVATYATVITLFAAVHAALGARRRAITVVSLVLFTIFVLVNFARFETTGAFDYGFAHENVRELMTPLGRRLVTAQVNHYEIAFLLVTPLLVGFVVLLRRPLPVWTDRRSRIVAGIACTTVLLGVPLTNTATHESVTGFATSAYRFHRDARNGDIALGGKPFPLIHDGVVSEAAAALSRPEQRRPHVIVLLLESWSGIYTDRKNAAGRPYTPVFDKHRRDGLSVDYFYASSMQSSRGRFAIMCSLIPLYRGKEFNDLADAPLHCLPHVMNEAGYTTLIHSASDEPGFERSGEFFGHMGFSEVRFYDRSRRSDPRMWGAGLQDDVYYRELFRALDDKVAKSAGAPIFAVAINTSNHYPFDRAPDHVPDTEGKSKYTRKYTASLHQVDGWLTTFFEELDRRPAFSDAIVVLIGDHSFPADEHGIHFNALGAREECFRTSFSLRWKGHVVPQIISDRAASQLDLAPTITDLLQIRHVSHFAGQSLVSGEPPIPAVMVQPYDGVRLAAVQYPYKLEVHDSAQQEHLFDLAKDPDEENDLLGKPAVAAETAVLRRAIQRIRESQAVLRAKRVWPSPTQPLTDAR